MREIKFRAWTRKEMVFDFTLNAFDGEPFDNIAEAQPNWILMQFTGLKDKNGKEIYEGDILEFHNTLYDLSTGEAVQCIKQVSIPEIYRDRDWFVAMEIEPGKVKGVEVIGNIYENLGLIT